MSLKAGPEAWLEAGTHPAPGLALFARGFARPDDAGILGGLRWEF